MSPRFHTQAFAGRRRRPRWQRRRTRWFRRRRRAAERAGAAVHRQRPAQDQHQARRDQLGAHCRQLHETGELKHQRQRFIHFIFIFSRDEEPTEKKRLPALAPALRFFRLFFRLRLWLFSVFPTPLNPARIGYEPMTV